MRQKTTITRLFISLIILLLITPLQANEKGLARVQTEANQFSQEAKVAIVVGVSDYPQRSGFRSLSYADDDAEALERTLKALGYSVQRLTNSDAMKSYILAAIREAGKMLDQDQGTLLFAFSGHGFAQHGKNYLAVNGAVVQDIEHSGLSVAAIKQAMRDTGARRRMLFIDACRNSPSEDKSSINASFVFDKDAEGVNVLYSTRSGAVSFENDQLQRGIFSHFLAKGLQGKAAMTNGVITFSSLAAYVEKQTKKWSFEQQSKAQIPYRAGESTGVFVLGKRDKNEVKKTFLSIYNLEYCQLLLGDKFCQDRKQEAEKTLVSKEHIQNEKFLIVKTIDKNIAFFNVDAGSHTRQYFEYQKYLADLKFHVIFSPPDEAVGTLCFLNHITGKVFDIDSWSRSYLVSPLRKRILITQRYSENFKIYKIENNTILNEFTMKFTISKANVENWRPYNAKWQQENVITFNKVKLQEAGSTVLRSSLVYENNLWKIKDLEKTPRNLSNDEVKYIKSDKRAKDF